MTSTEESQTVVNVGPVPATNPETAPPPAAAPNIKRNLELYQYGSSTTTKIPPLRRLFGKKGWKEVKAIVYEDSTLKVFEDSKLREAVFEIKLEKVALYLAFGKAANKLGPPPIAEDERNFVAPDNFFAVPESKERDKIHWFAAKDERNLKDLIQAIAETVEGKVNPPQLGKGPKYRYSPGDSESKWKTYWTTQMAIAHQAAAEPVEENGGDSKYVATPLVAVLEQQQQKASSPPVPVKNGTTKAKAKPTPNPRQQRDYYHVEFEAPEKVEVLGVQPDGGLLEESEEERKTIVVRLVNGKRVKEAVVAPKKLVPESSPPPPDYPPPPIPIRTLVVDERQREGSNGVRAQTNAELQRGNASPKIEVVTLVKEEPRLVSRPPSDMAKEEETIEVITSQHGAVASVASAEHTISTSTEYATNGASCTTTKETASVQQSETH